MLTTKQLLLFILLATLFACGPKKKDDSSANNQQVDLVYDLDEIKQAGKLRALVDYSTTSYFLYRGRPMGFEYELLSQFCESQDLELRIIPIKDLSSVMDSLNNFKGD